MLTHCVLTERQYSSVWANIIRWYEERSSSFIISSDYPEHIGDSVLFLCVATAASQATVNSYFGARDGNNITSHPSGGLTGDQITYPGLII